MIKSKSIRSKAFDFAIHFFLMLMMIAFIAPFIYLFAISISDPREVATSNVYFIPKGITFEAYTSLLKQDILASSYFNSILYTTVGTVITLAITCLSAFPLSLPNRLKGTKTVIVMYFAFTMFFSGGMIPTFLTIKNLGLLNTMWAIVLPTATSFWYIVITRTNFQSIPMALYESAYLDGANDWHVFFRIVLPLSKAVIATITLFAAVAFWNAYFPSLLYLNSEEMQPLSILLRRVLISNEVLNDVDAASVIDPVVTSGKAISARMATIFVSIGPIVLIYPFIQKYFVKGVMIGSVKG